jgi:multidrug efflux pump subunit AcrA (membrane-fusion protein)
MLIRISLILAIVAALAVGVVNFVFVKDKITTLTTDRNDQRSQKEQAQTELASTKKQLAQTQADLKQTQQQLADTQAERDKALADADAQRKRGDDLSDKLAKTTQERDVAQDELAAYKVSGLTAAQVAKLNHTLKDMQDAMDALNEEKLVLLHTRDRLQSQIDFLLGKNIDIVLPADLKGKIMVVDPKWDFVVLNIGDDQGVKPNSELLVSRDGKLVAKVIVRSLEKDRCIANVVPGWKLGEVIEGDEVSPAHPAS